MKQTAKMNEAGGGRSLQAHLHSNRFDGCLLRAGLVLAVLKSCLTAWPGQAAAFVDTAPLSTARDLHTASLLPNGNVLVAGGPFLSSTEVYDPQARSWTSKGSMATPRFMHTATLLINGKVLATGGDYYGALASAELFDPATGTWSATGNMQARRESHTATLLANGKVLVAGGFRGTVRQGIAEAELYDPVAGTWTATASMLSPRFDHTATLLSNGNVLVAGGYNQGSLSSAELYDPATATWTWALSMTTNRYLHTATLLPDGKVLVAGGAGSDTYNSAELYDPVANSWSLTQPMGAARFSHTATLLLSGKVLVAGGFGPPTSAIADAELYDPATSTWTKTDSLLVPRYSHSATLLPDGSVLLAGGSTTNAITSAAELFTAELVSIAPPQPQISVVTSPIDPDADFIVTGSGFAGSVGTTNQSSTPVVQLRSIENGQVAIVRPSSWNTNSVVSPAINALPPGWTLASVLVNGSPSQASIFDLQPLLPCPPLSALVSKGNIVLSWNAANPERFHLQTASDLLSGSWRDVGRPIVVTNGTGSVVLPAGSGTGLYRLKF